MKLAIIFDSEQEYEEHMRLYRRGAMIAGDIWDSTPIQDEPQEVPSAAECPFCGVIHSGPCGVQPDAELPTDEMEPKPSWVPEDLPVEPVKPSGYKYWLCPLCNWHNELVFELAYPDVMDLTRCAHCGESVHNAEVKTEVIE